MTVPTLTKTQMEMLENYIHHAIHQEIERRERLDLANDDEIYAFSTNEFNDAREQLYAVLCPDDVKMRHYHEVIE